MASPPKHTTLPTELLIAIAAQVEPSDIFSLRLSCRAISQATEDLFLENFFRRRVHLYSREGLQALVEITSQPHLIAKLEVIEICELCPDQWAWDKYCNDRERLLTLENRWHNEMYALDKGGDAFHLLSKVFRNCAAAKSIPKVIIHNDPAPVYGTTCWKRRLETLTQDCHCPYFPFASSSSAAATSSVLSAAAETAFPLTTLELQYAVSDFHRLKSTASAAEKHMWTKLLASCQHLTSFGFWLPLLEQYEGLDLVLQAAANLEELSMVTYETSVRRSAPVLRLFSAMECLSTTTLRSIELMGFVVLPDQLTSFLAKFAGTIRNLTLSNMGLKHSACWRPILAFLEQHLNLEYVKLHLMQRRGESYGLWSSHEYQEAEEERFYEFRGQGSIREGSMEEEDGSSEEEQGSLHDEDRSAKDKERLPKADMDWEKVGNRVVTNALVVPVTQTRTITANRFAALSVNVARPEYD